MATKTISLVLGSGGARGLAHIGIIHWLKENEYDIRSISGCSMGALVGGVYACDNSMNLRGMDACDLEARHCQAA